MESTSVPQPSSDFAATSGDFIRFCRTSRGLSEHTTRAYECDLRDFRRYLGSRVEIGKLERSDIRAYVASLQQTRSLKETTVRRRVATLRVFFAWIDRERSTQLSVFRGLDLTIRIPRRLPRTLHVIEMRDLLRVGARRTTRRVSQGSYEAYLNYFTLVALFTTGLRVGELVSAKLADVDCGDGAIQVRGKGNRERRVYMAGLQAIRVLKCFLVMRRRLLTPSDKLLVHHSGNTVTARRIRAWLRALAGEAGIVRRVTPHMLRHTAATQLLDAGVDIRFVQQLLGHASIATTQIYTHVSNASLKEHLTRANTLARVGQIVLSP